MHIDAAHTIAQLAERLHPTPIGTTLPALQSLHGELRERLEGAGLKVGPSKQRPLNEEFAIEVNRPDEPFTVRWIVVSIERSLPSIRVFGWFSHVHGVSASGAPGSRGTTPVTAGLEWDRLASAYRGTHTVRDTDGNERYEPAIDALARTIADVDAELDKLVQKATP